MRLRGKLAGGYALVRSADGKADPAWVSDPSQALRRLTPDEIRVLQADRDRYFSGFITF
jgi:hypothetical protein